MKKIFNTPNIKISVFESENIVTESNVAEPIVLTATEKANQDLKQKNVTNVINFTY